nr:vegetative cell wall protein gp1-like [Aegilops tauschii subsp. strangulata]
MESSVRRAYTNNFSYKQMLREKGYGFGILIKTVRTVPKPTEASYSMKDPFENNRASTTNGRSFHFHVPNLSPPARPLSPRRPPQLVVAASPRIPPLNARRRTAWIGPPSLHSARPRPAAAPPPAAARRHGPAADPPPRRPPPPIPPHNARHPPSYGSDRAAAAPLRPDPVRQPRPPSSHRPAPPIAADSFPSTPAARCRTARIGPPSLRSAPTPSSRRPVSPVAAPLRPDPVRPVPRSAPTRAANAALTLTRPARPPPPSPPAAAMPSCVFVMAPKKTPKGRSGFFGVRVKPFGNFGVEFSDAGRRWWLGTYPTSHEAACASGVAVWRAVRPKEHLNFPEIESQADAEMLVPQHPKYVQAKLKHCWKRDVEAKKKGVKKEDKAGPSTVIPIESSSEDRGDSDEEDEGCDDPDKDEFWEQFRSSDDEE